MRLRIPFILSLILIIISLTYFYSSLSDLLWSSNKSNPRVITNIINHDNPSKMETFDLWESEYRRCLIEKMKTKIDFGTLDRVVEGCNANKAREKFGVKYVKNKDDTKMAILPRTPTTSNGKPPSCTLVTLGIGGDIDAELIMKKLQPQCRFFGADPIRESGSIYEQLGKYFEIGVGSRTGMFKGSVLIKGKYVDRQVSTISMLDFLRDHVRQQRIDHLFMDNEGPEFEIMPQFLYTGVLSKNDFVVCQISLEMHGPLESYGMNETLYNMLINSLLTDSAYVPLWAERIRPHERSYFVNVKHPFCVIKYLRSAFAN